jgi:hypothetical protein
MIMLAAQTLVWCLAIVLPTTALLSWSMRNNPSVRLSWREYDLRPSRAPIRDFLLMFYLPALIFAFVSFY